ncbi:MAG: hypothetical protein U0Y82_14390 [Thermoleophilia bacterium]
MRALEPLAAALRDAHERARREAQRATDLEAAVAVLPDEAALTALAQRIDAAQGAVTAAQGAVEAARADRAAAEAAVGMLALRHGAGAAELGALGEVARAAADVQARRPQRAAQVAEGERVAQELTRALQRLTDEGRAAADAREAAVRARDALSVRAEAAQRAVALERTAADARPRDRAVQAHDAAVAARAAAQDAHDHAARLDLAAAVRGGLAPGDPCPVCGGTVGEHHPAAAGDITALRRAVEAAQGAERAAATERTRAALVVEGLERDLAALTPDPDPRTPLRCSAQTTMWR